MSNLRSTIKLESASGFPDKINITANSNSNIEGSVNIAKKKVVNAGFFDSINLITPQLIGRKGATVYASSPSSNNKVIALYTIQSLDNYFEQIFAAPNVYLATTEGPSPFARLKPGDSMLQHLPFEAQGVIAILEGGLDNVITAGLGGDPLITSTQTADLNYFIGDGGTSQGSSMAYLQVANNGSYDSYQVQIMDVDSGKKLKIVDLQINYNDDWRDDDFIIVQNKGYGLFFYNFETGNRTVVTVDKYGNVARIVDDVDSLDWSHFSGRGFYATHNDGGTRYWKVFDGENTYYYDIECSDWNLEDQWDNSTLNGNMVITASDVYGNSGYTATFMLSGGNLVKLNENRSLLTGLISTNDATTIVTGNGTKFTTETKVGDAIYDDLSAGILIGTIVSVNSDTEIVLGANATTTSVNYGATVQHNNVTHRYYVYDFGKTLVHTVYDTLNSKYASIKLWNEDGFKIKDLDLSTFFLLDFSFSFYGTGRFSIISRANASGGDGKWRLFVYDPLTNKLHGEDGNWTVDYTLHPEYTSYSFSTNMDNWSYESSINSETFVAAFYDNAAFFSDVFINQYSNHLNIEVLFPGSPSHDSYDLTVEPGICWRNTDSYYPSGVFPTSEYVRFHTSTGTHTTGNLIANTIVPGANTIVQTPIADLTKISIGATSSYNESYNGRGSFNASVLSKTIEGTGGNSWTNVVQPGYRIYDSTNGNNIGTVASVISDTLITLVENSQSDSSNGQAVFVSESILIYLPFGEYAFYAYYKSDTHTSVFAALDKGGNILDTLEVPGACTTDNFWVHQYNTFYFYIDLLGRNYYFNNSSKKFIQIPYYYGGYELPQMAYSTGVNTGNILLDDTDPWQILSPNALSPEIRIPDQYDPFSRGDFMGENYLFVTFNDDNKPDAPIIILVYDLLGNLVNTVETFYNDYDNRVCYGDRMELYLINSLTESPDAIALVTPNSIEYSYDVNLNYWTISNDWEWQQDYWC